MNSSYNIRKAMTLEQATDKALAFRSTMPYNAPLRFRPVVVEGPNGGYIVIELGIAEKHGLKIVK